MKKLILLAIGSTVLLSCGVSYSDNQVIDDVKDGQAKWERSNTSNYEYTYQTICFCFYTDEMIVVVQSDTVAQVLNPNTREPLMIQQGDEEKAIFEEYPNLFHTISDFYEQWMEIIPEAHEARFEWDKSSGIPIYVYIDRSKNIADDETLYNFSNLKIN